MSAAGSPHLAQQPRLLDLKEIDDWKIEVLTDTQVGVLSASDLVEIRPQDPYRDVWEVRAKGAVGAALLTGVSGEQIDLRVEPKVGIDRLLFLMGYASDAKGWRNDWVDLPHASDIPSAAAEALVRLTDRALRSGLLQGYLSIDESGMTVRGRVRQVDQMRRHFGQMIPVEVSYDEFTIDIAENRILKAALRRLLRISSLQPSTRQRLLRTAHRFAEVSDLVGGQSIPNWTPSRLNARYVPALRLAEIVLSGSSFDLDRGLVRASGFMVSMPTVFEDFVTKALGAALVQQCGGRMQLQDNRWRLDADGQVRLRPDLVWYPSRDSKVPGVVVDAKYKAAKLDGFPNPDVYQMLAYCTSLGLNGGHLVYAAGNEAGAHYRIPNAGPSGEGVDVHAVALDLAGTPTELLRQVGALAEGMLRRPIAID